MVQRYYSSVATEMTLLGSVGTSATTVQLDTVAGLPVSTPFTLVLDVGLPSEEIVTVTGVAGTTLTVVRGQDGTAPAAHTAGAPVRHMMTARDLREPQQHMAAVSGVHGVASTLVGVDDEQTLTNKTIDAADNTLIGVFPAGMVTLTAAATAPDGWLLCQGQSVSRTTYANLFAAIGTTFGVGDGSTTFTLPNLKGRVPVGVDAGQTEFNELNKSGGAKTHTLTENEMPSHNHTASTGSAGSHNHSGSTGSAGSHSHSGTTGSESITMAASATDGLSGSRRVRAGSDSSGRYEAELQFSGHTHPFTTSTTGSHSHSFTTSTTGSHTHTVTVGNRGGGQAHNNLQPYITLNYIIKY